jgi:hypothetical protein
VVGRFVEQQHVRLAVGDQRQRQARALAAGETVDALEGAVADEVPLAEEAAQLLLAALGSISFRCHSGVWPSCRLSTVCCAK